MRLHIAALAAGAALIGGTGEAASLEIRDAVARVTIVPEARSDIRVEVIRPNGDLPLSLETRGDRTVLDGGLAHRIRSCHGEGEKVRVSVRGVGQVGWDEMPEVVVHAPREVAIETNGAIQGVIGRSASLDLHNSGCSGWTIADVAGDAAIHESGAGSVRMGAAERLAIRVSGAANIHAVQARDGLDAQLSGAGGVRVDWVQGPVEARVSGVGRVKVADGRASTLRASVSGLGAVEFGGEADALDASISGLGSIRVKAVDGPISKSVSGGGHISIGEE
jgi:hypothetical protein